MKFGGIQKTTLLDFPGEVAATLFVMGCNFRCPYCHNPDLVNSDERLKVIEWQEIYEFLSKRRNVLGGVCITGGEPLLYDEMPKIIDKIHKLGLKVKIDTNGSLPERLKNLNCDYIAMDIKTSLDKYKLIKYQKGDDITILISNSIRWIIESGIQHEFRTTVVPEIVTIEDIKEITKIIKGAQKYNLAQFRPKNTLEKDYENKEPYPISIIQEMREIIVNSQIECEIRGI